MQQQWTEGVASLTSRRVFIDVAKSDKQARVSNGSAEGAMSPIELPNRRSAPANGVGDTDDDR